MRLLRMCGLLFAVLAATIALAAHAAAPATRVGPGAVYLALGDSLTTGSNGQGTPTRPYPSLVGEGLLAVYPDTAVQILGRDSETSATLISDGQLVAAEALIAERRAAGQPVGLVTLSIGGNDMVGVITQSLDPQATLDAFSANLAVILDRLVAAVTVDGIREADLLIVEYYNPYPGVDFFGRGQLADIWIPQFNQAIAAAAAARNITVVPIAEAFAGNEASLLFVQPDQCLRFIDIVRTCDYHPTNAGQQVIADQVLATGGYIYRVALPLVVSP